MAEAGVAAEPAEKPYPKWLAAPEAVLAVAFLVAGNSRVYAVHQPPGTDLVRLQWSTVLTKDALDGIRQHSAEFRTALDWDMWVLIPGYFLGLLLACHLGTQVFWTPRFKVWAWSGMAATGLACACNYAQDGLLLTALSDGLRPGALLDWVEVLSFVKFTALLVAGPLGVVAIMVTIGRLVTSKQTRDRWEHAVNACGPDPAIPPPVIEDAANQSTSPGRPAVPFMLAHDYIGGPATGWVRTDFLQKILNRYVQDDLTVEAAVAISGAAFASAMGSQTRFYEVFLAIANARLGAWLPNPFFVALKLGNLHDWTIPGLPGRRRLSYFAREIFGIHSSIGRMLLCTDGGHYDNLGLVELLRRRCETIYCIDASGASLPLADALAGAITLAREELGVEVSFTNEVYDLIPGGWDQLKPADSFKDLNSRLAKSQVAVGRVTYPAIAGRPGKQGYSPRRGKEGGRNLQTHGRLVFAQAVLTQDIPYQLLDFPQGDAGFPHDSTGDQFFDVGRFDAYQMLGHVIGQKAARLPAAAADGDQVPGQFDGHGRGGCPVPSGGAGWRRSQP